MIGAVVVYRQEVRETTHSFSPKLMDLQQQALMPRVMLL